MNKDAANDNTNNQPEAKNNKKFIAIIIKVLML